MLISVQAVAPPSRQMQDFALNVENKYNKTKGQNHFGYVLNLSYKKRVAYTGIKKTFTSHGNNRNKMPTLQQ
jgi:hypothetical protein